jgi:hypothetical protein
MAMRQDCHVALLIMPRPLEAVSAPPGGREEMTCEYLDMCPFYPCGIPGEMQDGCGVPLMLECFQDGDDE